MVILGRKKTLNSLVEIFGRVSTGKGFLVCVLVVTGILPAACGYLPNKETPNSTSQPGLTETIGDNGTPETNEVPFAEVTPSVVVTPTATEVVVRTEFAKGEIMTQEELKVNVDWFYSISDEELSALTKDKLWSFSDYKGDNRPRDIDGNILSEIEDLGYITSHETIMVAPGPLATFEFSYFNVMYLGTVKVTSDQVDYYVGGFGMKTPDGKRLVVYGIHGFKGNAISVGSLVNVDLYGRVFGSNNQEDVDQEEYISLLLNKHLKNIVMIETIKLTNGDEKLIEGTLIDDRFLGDERLVALIMDGYRHLEQQSSDYFEALLGIEYNILKNEYSDEDLKYFAGIVVVLVEK
jgi:hypothetical protein